MIWFRSFVKTLGKDTYLANRMNMVADTLAVIFLIYGRDTPNPIYSTPEPFDNNFIIREVVI